jgi:cytochrome c biogenesis protein CcmG, thiol:disulfide interchange protein DsbE
MCGQAPSRWTVEIGRVQIARWLVAFLALMLVAAAFIYHVVLVGIAKGVYHSMGLGGPGLVQTGQKLPALTFESLDGSSVMLRPAAGRVTFINVFASWCPPCQEESPALAAFAKGASAKGVDVIGIDRQETPLIVDAFRARFGTTYPMVIDQGWASRDVLGARAMPETVVVDGRGIVRAMVSGPLTLEQMQALAARARRSS